HNNEPLLAEKNLVTPINSSVTEDRRPQEQTLQASGVEIHEAQKPKTLSHRIEFESKLANWWRRRPPPPRRHIVRPPGLPKPPRRTLPIKSPPPRLPKRQPGLPKSPRRSSPTPK
ncbi:unnamed protein product, partial [Ilex paraguariensis]